MSAPLAPWSPAERDALAVKAKLFRGLADPTRLRVLEALRSQPLCVGDVVELTGLRQPTVSMHLTCLWECGLIDRERRGRFVYYSIVDKRVHALLGAGDDLLVRVGDRIYVCTRYRDETDEPSAPVAIGAAS